MAAITTGTVTGDVDVSALMQDHSDIRRENTQSEANVRRDTAYEGGFTRRDIQETTGDVRREAAEHASDVRREAAEHAATSAYQNATQHGGIVDAVKTVGWHNSDRTGTEADRVTGQASQYFIAAQQYAFDNSRDVAALKATTDLQFANTMGEIKTQGALGQAAASLEGAKTAAAVALAGERAAAATALAQALLGQQIVADGNSTRALINAMNADALNRQLIERNAEIVSERDRSHYWHGQHNNGQFAAVTSQLNAFQSQLQETRQGMVNFGTMAGVGQSSTSNNVR